MKVYCIASVIYIIYTLYLRFTKAELLDELLKDNENLKNKYNKIKKNRIMVFIIGIVIGLVYLIITEPTSINIPQIVSNTKSFIEDVSDISVI
jgi:glucan phosphoethanolaminetransferase (alkaline phosphatase superfamily)